MLYELVKLLHTFAAHVRD